MKKLFKILAIVFAFVILVSSFAGCHPKDEVAITVGNYNFSSAYYSCALVLAESEARVKVDESLTAAGEKAENVDYSKQTIDGVKFADYVKNKAIEVMKMNAAVKTKLAELNIKLDDDSIYYADYYTNMYWNSYGYGAVLSEYGVSMETYNQYITDSYYSDKYFTHLYDEGGEKALSEDKLKEILNEKYVLADCVSEPLTTTGSDGNSTKLSEDKITELQNKLQGFADELNSGKKSWEEIYKLYNKEEDKNNTSSTASTTSVESTASSTSTTSTVEEEKPVEKAYPYATLFGDADTGENTTLYETVKGYEIGKATVYKDSTTLYLIVKRDVTADPYYTTEYRTSVTYTAEKDNYEQFVRDFANTLSFSENKFATGQFKVSDIKYDTEA